MASSDPAIQELRQELGAVESRMAERLDNFETRTNQRFSESDRRFGEFEARTDQRFTALETRLADFEERTGERFAALDQRLVHMFEHIDATAIETRRHFDLVAERLDSRIQLVAEGVALLDDKVERFRDETRENFERVDRRFLHLEARVSALERR